MGVWGMTRRLKTMADGRRYTAWLINATETGEVDSQIAGKLGYLLSILQRFIVDGDLEQRLERLEREMKI